MAKADSPHLIRLANSINNYIGSEEASKIITDLPLSKSADIGKKFIWTKNVTEYMDKNYSKEQIVRIRKACPCNDGISIASKLSKYHKKADSVKSFVELFNANESFAFLEYISESSLLFCYPTCYCSCIKRIPDGISKSWCYCTLGNVEAIFKLVFEKDVKVELLDTVKTGGKRCAIKVEW